ncbi:MAG: alpha/beta hydrolase [Parcubacteria group bacterium]|nr:alpha/beta hydrolase [Parcubacteria group bacterium]
MQKKQKHVHARSIKERPKQTATWRVIIVHGLHSHPADCWFPWLKQALEERGFAAQVPRMPTPNAPEMKKWVATITKAIGMPNEYTILVGHSLGVIALLRYLETLQSGERVAGLISVAGRVGFIFFPVPHSLENCCTPRQKIHWHLFNRRPACLNRERKNFCAQTWRATFVCAEQRALLS